MQTQLAGRIYEKKAAAETEGTESRLVLYALRDALRRFNIACDIVVHTECGYAAAAINNGWPAIWRENGWQTARGTKTKDSGLWRDILWEWEDAGHRITAMPGQHTFSLWMRANLPRMRAGKGVFSEIEERDEMTAEPVGDWMRRDPDEAAVTKRLLIRKAEHEEHYA